MFAGHVSIVEDTSVGCEQSDTQLAENEPQIMMPIVNCGTACNGTGFLQFGERKHLSEI